MTAALVALGAAVGAVVRFLVSRWADDERFPAGTLLVNVAGSFLLGLLVARGVTGNAAALLGTGFCGGLTTYSSFAVQTHRLGRARGTGYAAATIAASLTACTVGFLIAA